MFVTVTLNPAIDCTVQVDGRLALNGVYQVVSETRTPGGKGINVAKVIAGAGGTVCAGGILGEPQAAFFDGFLRELGVQTHFHLVPHPTRENVMVVDTAGTELKVNRPGFPDLAYDGRALERYCLHLASGGEVVVLSGSWPAGFPADVYARLVAALRKRGKTVVLDTSGAALAPALDERPAVIKPNRAELEAVLGRAPETDTDMAAELRGLLKRHEAVVVSDGARGAYFAHRDGVFHVAAPRVEVVDTTGAGDALLGRFCADYFPDRELTPTLMRRAVAAGSAAVERHGTPAIPPTRVDKLAAGVTVTGL
jgi:1-phosphofructokinase family hexose kinase